VLVVEDEEQVRDVTVRLLQRAGYEVVASADAEAALGALAAAGSFDVVLTDSAMPGMRGEELAAEIAHTQPELPVILMSGYTERRTSQPAGAAAAFIHKPFTPQTLLEQVRRVILGD
jgi:DNA-binding NtrC family response regulator